PPGLPRLASAHQPFETIELLPPAGRLLFELQVFRDRLLIELIAATFFEQAEQIRHRSGDRLAFNLRAADDDLGSVVRQAEPTGNGSLAGRGDRSFGAPNQKQD